MALNFKLHVNKACFESLCISTIYYVLVIIGLILVQMLVVLT